MIGRCSTLGARPAVDGARPANSGLTSTSASGPGAPTGRGVEFVTLVSTGAPAPPRRAVCMHHQEGHLDGHGEPTESDDPYVEKVPWVMR